jgi:protein-S-isoprenylcysteine O-methyltransferase Ste14
MSDAVDRPNRIPWPPVLYAAGLAAPWLLQKAVPLPVVLEDSIAADLQTALGLALLCWGVSLGYFAIRSFMGAGTAIHPTHPADRLVTFGLYNTTRNPMYLGAMIAFLGLALLTGNVWRFVALPMLFYGLSLLAILPEEAYLRRRFGAEFDLYASKVRRWF